MAASTPFNFILTMWVIFLLFSNYWYGIRYKQAHRKTGISRREFELKSAQSSTILMYKSNPILNKLSMYLMAFNFLFLTLILGKLSISSDVAYESFLNCAITCAVSGLVAQIAAYKQYKTTIALQGPKPKWYFPVRQTIMILRDFGGALLFVLYYFS